MANPNREDERSSIKTDAGKDPDAPREDDLAYIRSGLGRDLETVLVFNLLRTHSYLAPFIDSDLRQNDLTAAQFNTLLVLYSAGIDGMRMSEIGRKLVVTKANVTGLIDRLERQGLVARATEQDRRATAVRLTPEGDRIVRKVGPALANLLADLTACLSASQKQSLVELLTALRRGLRERRRKS